MKAVLKVFCPVDEVDAAGRGLAVGEALERLASQRGLGRAVLGTDVEDVSWVLDRDALLVEQPAAVIRGRVAALDAVYVTMTGQEDGGWVQKLGSARTETQVSTSDARRERPRIDWTIQQESPAAGPTVRGGFRTWIEGEQVLAGWIVTLDAEQVSPPEAASSTAVREAVDADHDALWPLVREFATSFVLRRADFEAALPRLLAR